MSKAFRLLPRQDKFYTYLSDLSNRANLAARHLKTYAESKDSAERTRLGLEIKGCRNQSKEIMALMTDELCRTFITPFDREDIQRFSQYLYRIPKMIEKVVQRMEMHGLSPARADFIRQIDLIVGEGQVAEEMVNDLIGKRDMRKAVEKVRLLRDLEQKGDDVLNELLASLFKDEHDVKDMILRKDLYDMLEKVIDCYRNAADVTLQIVLKYS